jgi:hypothetical protein
MPELNSHGRVQRAQATTTKCSCIQMEQQLHWHNETESVWGDHHRLNQPVDEYKNLQPFFQINFDETGVLVSTGVLWIVGSAEVKKHKNNSQDNHNSITIVQIGSAGGTSGPWIFLIKWKELERKCPLRNLEKNFPGVPPGSKVVCTENVYMTNKTWVELAPFIAHGICLMPHIKDHPAWQVCLTLDGFFSHLVPASLAPFTATNITVIKAGRGHIAGEQSTQSISGQRRQEGHQRVAWSSPIPPKACNHKAVDYYCSMYWCT